MRSRAHVRAGLYLTATAAVFALVLAHETTPSGAHHDSTHSMAAMSIDMRHDATPANDAFSIGSRETCARIDENNVQDTTGPFAINPEDGVDQQLIDVTADDITPYNNNGTPADPADDTGGIIGYQYELGYTSGSLSVVAQDITNPPGKLDVNPGSSLLNASDSLPDSDGVWLAAVLDTGAGAPESGDGVLGRITLETSSGAMTGVHTVSLSNNAHLDAQGTAYIPHVTNSAFISINEACPGTATITVDSTADNNTSDTVVTLREAMLLAIGGTGGDGTSTGLGRALSGSEADNVSGTPGAASSDSITFDSGTFPPGTPATITLTSQLPAMTSGGDTIAGVGAGVIVDGVTRTFNCFVISGESSDGSTISGIRIRRCILGVNVTSGADNNVVGGTTVSERNVISENTNGVSLDGAGVTGNIVRGNYIGTDATGSAAAGNSVNGVLITNGASSNVIGGTLSGAGNVISGNSANAGVRIQVAGSDNNLVVGNYLGLNAAGTAAIGNFVGVSIGSGAQNNTIGGATAAERNIISGNSNKGVEIAGASTNGNVVRGNRIGTTADGATARGNGLGVEINSGAQNNTIGGSGAGQGNLISGNAFYGVAMQNPSTSNNTVRGNYIGTDVSGTLDLGNSSHGVFLVGSASSNTIGGSASGDGNVISGNNAQGILISDAGSTNNTVLGNFIGTSAAGTAAIPNSTNGVLISNAPNSTIGGTAAGARNVISGNAGTGVSLSGASATGNVVAGNYVGTDVTGALDVGNGSGISVVSGATTNTIGGTTAGARNVISGNDNGGISINSSTGNNTVQGNYVGLNAAGTTAMSNGGRGISLSNSPNNTIGGTVGTTPAGACTGACNAVAGNSAVPFTSGIGIDITGTSSTGNVVRGNFVGTNASGTAAVPNSAYGIVMNTASSNTVGGTTAAARNLASGNSLAGISLAGGVTSNVVQGNYVGTDTTGTVAIPNSSGGIVISALSTGNTVGGTAAGAGNLISGNASRGVLLQGASNVVQGNFIGTQADGGSPLGNAVAGISILSAGSNTIGGTLTGAENVIAYNTGDGVEISGAAATGNTVRRNSIHANTLLGIDNESGGNTELAPPVITSVDPDTSTISGTTCSGCTVEVFSDGVDEGRVFHGVATTTGTDWSFTGAFGGPQLTATATDGSGNTSEFSSPVPLVVLGAASGDTAPNTGGTFGNNADLGVNNGGQAVFRNTVDGSAVTEGIFAFFGANPNPTSVVLEGQSTQTAIGGDYATFGPPVNNNAGTIVYQAAVTNGTASQGLFAFFGASTEVLAWQGGSEPPPLTGTFSTFSAPAVNNLNQVAAVTTLLGGSQTLYAFFGASPTPDKRLAIVGDTAPGGAGTYTGFGDPTINDLGQVAARATLSGSSEGLFAFFGADPTPPELIVKKGDSLPSPLAGTFNGFGNPSINNGGLKGRVAARATILGGSATEGVFAFFGASPTQALALQGQVAPGTGGATYVSFGDPVINDLGQVVVKATLTGGPVGAPTEGIFAFFGASALALVLEGDVAPSGGTYQDFLHIAFNDVAQIVFVANVPPSSQGVFFASLDLDRDGIVDFQDNCPTTFNTDQNNNEGDAQGNACDPDDDNDGVCDPAQSGGGCSGSDNCVFVYNPAQSDVDTDTIGDACDTGDTDIDGFSDRLEIAVGTNPALDCGTNAYPPDFNSDTSVSGLDLSQLAADIGKSVPPAPARKDIAPDPPDKAVTGADLSAIAGVIGTSCAGG